MWDRCATGVTACDRCGWDGCVTACDGCAAGVEWVCARCGMGVHRCGGAYKRATGAHVGPSRASAPRFPEVSHVKLSPHERAWGVQLAGPLVPVRAETGWRVSAAGGSSHGVKALVFLRNVGFHGPSAGAACLQWSVCLCVCGLALPGPSSLGPLGLGFSCHFPPTEECRHIGGCLPAGVGGVYGLENNPQVRGGFLSRLPGSASPRPVGAGVGGSVCPSPSPRPSPQAGRPWP